MDDVGHGTLILQFVFVLSVCVSSSSGIQKIDICHLDSCSSARLANQSMVRTTCSGKGYTVQGKCCINETSPSTLVGVDLSSCNLTSLTNIFTDHMSIQTLIIDDNPLVNCSTDDFKGLANLTYLSLPRHCGCPGEEEKAAWYNVSHTNVTAICQDPVNICIASNITCPNNSSQCVLDGPGSTLCLCKPGFYGYKCRKLGEFQWMYYGIGLGASTLLVSAFLWCTQRRKVMDMKQD